MFSKPAGFGDAQQGLAILCGATWASVGLQKAQNVGALLRIERGIGTKMLVEALHDRPP
jgi:hypothetical protein